MILVLAAVLSASGQSAPARPGKGGPAPVRGPLLRMDLLGRHPAVPVPVKRDPFVAGGPSGEAAEGAMPRPGAGLSGRPFPGGRLGGAKPGLEPPAEAPAEPALNLRYVGFVRGKDRILALVLVNGQASAVGAGDILGDAWKVAAVTAAEIEIQGSDGATLKFALEGERK